MFKPAWLVLSIVQTGLAGSTLSVAQKLLSKMDFWSNRLWLTSNLVVGFPRNLRSYPERSSPKSQGIKIWKTSRKRGFCHVFLQVMNLCAHEEFDQIVLQRRSLEVIDRIHPTKTQSKILEQEIQHKLKRAETARRKTQTTQNQKDSSKILDKRFRRHDSFIAKINKVWSYTPTVVSITHLLDLSRSTNSRKQEARSEN